MTGYSSQISTRSIVITWADTGVSLTVPAGTANYQRALNAIKSGATGDRLRALLQAETMVAAWSGGAIIERDGIFFCNIPGGKAVEVNKKLANVLRDFVRNDWPVESFCRFVYRLMQNPSQRSVETFYEYIERYGLTITDDGMVRGYKAITNDWKDKHTRSVDNSIGATPTMPRNGVDDDPNAACSRGFHFGCMQYVKDFACGFGTAGGDRIVLIEADPADIVCVPRDCSWGKVRCCTYKVLSEYRGELAAYAGAGLKKDVEDGKGAVKIVAEIRATQHAKVGAQECPSCGEKIRASYHFCPVCGYKLKVPAKKAAPKKTAPKKTAARRR